MDVNKKDNYRGKHIIGKVDKADLPLFGLENINVKIDSGAFTSTIHCSIIEESKKGLKVIFLNDDEEGYTGIPYYFKNFEFKLVRSSSGEAQERYVVEGDIVLFNEHYITEFSLSKRDLMKYPVLLGRKLLSKNFLIDTSRSNLSYKRKRKT